jgi:hypothetical protein
MKLRLLPLLGVTGLLSIALAGSAVAGGGGWPPPPGTYTTKDISATANLVGATTTVCYPTKGCFPQYSEFAWVSVDRGLHTFQPQDGATLVQQNGTMVTLTLKTLSGTYIFGCWMIAGSDFIVAEDLSSASLSTTVPGESNCPGTPLAVSSTNVVTSKGGAGGGGGGGGSTGPITLHLNWTSKGVVSHGQNQGELACGSFATEAQQRSDRASATSQGQITGASANLTSQFASIDDSTTEQVVQGTPVNACFS